MGLSQGEAVHPSGRRRRNVCGEERRVKGQEDGREKAGDLPFLVLLFLPSRSKNLSILFMFLLLKPGKIPT